MKNNLYRQIAFCFVIVFLCSSCIKLSSLRSDSDNTESSINNENKADVEQDTIMLDETDDGIGDEENWSDDNDYESETNKLDGYYTERLPGKWFCNIANENNTEYVDGNKITFSMNASETLLLYPDFNYKQKIFTRIIVHTLVELNNDGPFHGGATIDITGESTGTWYVENSNLVQHFGSWKITPTYHHEHGEKRNNGHFRADDKVIQELAPTIKEVMDDLKRVYSEGASSRYIMDLQGGEMRISSNGETNTYKKQQ